ncbi:Hsp70 family protein [Actinomadura graeca]|uniref:Hsp70 family protein n=1 Tax=Actinomadura graeca TaxID=2750812 RepID=A0ABX8R273_9ACTN|nr:Hsp70 family protein [Actinomadura graeca]
MWQGQVLDGKYRLDELLGRGGNGHVWRGLDLAFERPVAVKLVPDSSREDLNARLRREGRIIAWLNGRHHPAIATVYDQGLHHGYLYLVMEYLHGEDLQTVISRNPVGLDLETVVDYGIQIAEGLAAAHAAGVVHRDVKPGNIMLVENGRVKICDFGIAHMEGATIGLTQQYGRMGSPQFMAPEQFEGLEADARTDLYALGCTLYTLLAGVPPFSGTPTSLRHQHATTSPLGADLHRHDAPPALVDLIDELLAKTPAERPGDGREVAARLRTVRRGGSRAVGLDLGTSESVISLLEGGDPTVVTTSEGARALPSVVGFTAGGGTAVGENARRQEIGNIDRTVRSSARELGTGWTTVVDDRELGAEHIGAVIMRKLKDDAQNYLDEGLGSAVIAVPAGCTTARRQAVRRAARAAGLDVLRLIPAPVAAALAYYHENRYRDDNANIVIFDLGGGTFDVAVAEIGDGVVDVKALDGDQFLGGDDWDARIRDWLAGRFQEAHGIDLAEDKTALGRLRQAAEKAKIELHSAQETVIDLPYIASTADGPLRLRETLTRAEFQRITADLLERCKGPLLRAVKDAELTVDELDHVVLVGGGTRMPAISGLVRELTGKEPNRSVNPDEVVAVGAALQAGCLKGEVKDTLLLDVAPLSLGIGTRGGLHTKIIERNTTLPTKRSEIFTTGRDDQTSVVVAVYEGEREIAEYNRRIGVLRLDLPPAPRGVPRIEVMMDTDSNGVTEVSVKDLGTGRERTLRLPDDTSDTPVTLEDAPCPLDAERE